MTKNVRTQFTYKIITHTTCAHTHTHTHTHIHTHTLTLTHTLVHSHTHTHTSTNLNQILANSPVAVILEILEAIKDVARKWIKTVPLGLFGEPSLSAFIDEVREKGERESQP